MKTRNSEVLRSFTEYCEANPSQRFWQALRNWSGHSFIYVSPQKPPSSVWEDTFYWEGRDKALEPQEGSQRMNEIATMQRFDTELIAFWETVKGKITGALWPMAQETVHSEWRHWLEPRLAGASYEVTCNTTNNPPAAIAVGEIKVRVMVQMFGKVWKWELST